MDPIAARLLARIVSAPVYDVARRTPLVPAPRLSGRLGQEVWLKREDQQPTFSFKLRGAYACLHHLAQDADVERVVAASAGNHAQGVALAARHLGLKAVIFMPRTTPTIKVDAVQALGAEVRLEGDDYDRAERAARAEASSSGGRFVHPFDDPRVIAGQGTVGLEIAQQCRPAADAVFVPVGGGGLLAGVATALRALSPSTRVIGVEPVDAASLQASLKAGRRVRLDAVDGFADGAAVRRVGALALAAARRWVDEVITVDADQICAAMRDIFEDTRTLVEPAGALAVAGLKHYARRLDDSHRLVAINSGANVNFDRLGHVVERAVYGHAEEALLCAAIPERPGSFLRFCQSLGPQVITEFNYRYGSDTQARVFVGVRVDGPGASRALIRRLIDAGYPVEDFSHNTLARSHVRHLVGGCLPSCAREVLYRFEFPERPGALLDFLSALAGRWNISLFHYRNHGAAYGRVLVGMMVPEQDQARFEQFLDETGYRWIEETGNPAYRHFLATPEQIDGRLRAVT